MENSLSGQLDDEAAFKQVMARKAPSVAEASPSGALSDEQAFNQVMARPKGANPFGAPPASAPKGPAPLRSRYQQAGARPAPNERELSLKETFQGAGRNLIPSTVEMGKGIVSAAMNPMETLGAIGKIGTGIGSQAVGALGIKQDQTKKVEDEALARALGSHYVQTYGSVKGFKKALSTDPASILADASTFLLGPGGAAAKGAGLVKTGAALSKAAEFVDPIQLALKAAKLPVKAVGKIMPVAQSFTTGASVSSLAKAAEAASAKATPEQRAAFQAHINKKADPSEIVGAMDDALDAIAKKRSDDYIAKRKSITGGVLQPLSFKNIATAFKERVQQNRLTDPMTGFVGIKNPNVENVMKEIGAEISRYSAQPVNSMAHTLEGFDALKQRINAIRKGYKNDPQAYQAATQMHNEILKELILKESGYGNLMKQYSNASDEMAAIRERFGVGKNLSDETVLKKVLKSKFGKGKESENLLSSLAEHDSRIPYMIAGHELSDALPGGLRQALMYSAPFNPAGIVGGIAHLAASSPKLMGKMNYAAGTVGRGVDALTQPAVTKALSYAGQQRDDNAIGSGPQGPQSAPAAVAKVVSAIEGHEGTGAERSGSTSAYGPGQFVVGTFLDTFRAALPDEAASMTDDQIKALHGTPEGDKIQHEKLLPFLTMANAGKLEEAGIEPTPGNIYLAHLLNVETAKPFINTPDDVLASSVLPESYINRGNASWLSGKTVGQVKQWAKNQIEGRMNNAAATGGRIQRASGGRIDSGRHEALVNKLMKKAERAKSVSNKVTEPLLEVPDKAIVKALDMAQQAI